MVASKKVKKWVGSSKMAEDGRWLGGQKVIGVSKIDFKELPSRVPKLSLNLQMC